MPVLLIVNRNTWAVPNQFICSIGIFIAFHVMEEWKFPGGFHYQYNLDKNSADPNRYPMNRKSDMFTNFGGTVFFSILTFLPGNNVFTALAVCFGLGETLITLVILFAISMGLFINGFEKMFASETTRYGFADAGYYEKYIRGEEKNAP